MIRVLQDPPLDGPANMARDEALMGHVGRLEYPPTLRLYQWNPPTISLGYFQPYADYESLPPPAGTLPVVRRLTGGGAILHDLELTYSLTLPSGHQLIGQGANRLYELAHDAVIACLGSLGLQAAGYGLQPAARGLKPEACREPFFCFERRHCYDVLIGQDKIAGSAQRRRRDALLQHGSIILGCRYSQQASAVSSAYGGSGSGQPLPFDDAIRHIRSALVGHLAEVTGEAFQPGAWSTEELATADELTAKYVGDAWTKRT